MSAIYVIHSQLKDMLKDGAVITIDGSNKLIIAPPPTTILCSGHHLELLVNPGWNDINISKDIQLEFVNWLIDVDDHEIGKDLWCIQWLKEKYTVIDNCTRWKYNGMSKFHL